MSRPAKLNKLRFAESLPSRKPIPTTSRAGDCCRQVTAEPQPLTWLELLIKLLSSL